MRLLHPTPRQIRLRDELTHEVWGVGLSPEQFCQRECRLRAHPFAAGAMDSWWWVDAEGRPLSSCETFAMPARWRRGDGTRAEGPVFAVASVYTEPDLRGLGHAGAMMEALLFAMLRKEPAALGSILFSDVGQELYARTGYQPATVSDVVLPARSGDPKAGVDALLFEGRLGMAAAPNTAAPGLQVLPGGLQLDWQVERERAYATAVGTPRLSCHGAVRGEARAAWCVYPRQSELVVLTLHGHHSGDVAAVLACAQRVASQAGLGTVRLWQPTLEVDVADLEEAQVQPREGSLPMLKPFVAGLTVGAWKSIPRALWV